MAIVTPSGETHPLIGGRRPLVEDENMVQEVDVAQASTPLAQRPTRRTKPVGQLRSLSRQARLIAVACLIVDVVVFISATSDLPSGLRIGALIAIIGVDTALALPPKYSGQLAVAHAVVTVGLAFVLQATPNTDWTLAGGLIAAYRVGAWLRKQASFWALAALATAAAASGWLAHAAVLPAVLTAMENALIPWLVGRYTSARRGYIEELRHNRELELRDATAQMERAAERLRTSIARDLHDVIGHHVSAIGVHAGAARLWLRSRSVTDPEVIDSLTAVEASTRSAMLDLRRVLDILHGAPESTNQPGLENLGELFDGVRRSGLVIDFHLKGASRNLPGSLDAALYRIAQEMLTNALRHGDGSAVDVTLDFGEDSVTLSARNRVGRPGREDGPETGRGLEGIRSRVALFDGQVSQGRLADGKTWQTTVTVHTDAAQPGEPS